MSSQFRTLITGTVLAAIQRGEGSTERGGVYREGRGLQRGEGSTGRGGVYGEGRGLQGGEWSNLIEFIPYPLRLPLVEDTLPHLIPVHVCRYSQCMCMYDMYMYQKFTYTVGFKIKFPFRLRCTVNGPKTVT